MQVQETYVNATDGYMFYESNPYTPFTDNRGELFKAYQKESGRCISSVYIDDVHGNSHKVGWVFLKKEKYDDCKDTYLLETWVRIFPEK